MFGFEVWFDGCCIHAEHGFDNSRDAEDEGYAYVDTKLDDWSNTIEDDYEVIVK